jgi:hypothetical protein
MALDPDAIYFPEADIIPSFAYAFMRMMFAHANFEGEVDRLQRAITSAKSGKRWDARSRPNRMADLIEKHLGSIPEAKPITQILTHAIDPCDRRNLLAHGRWWRFDPKTATITIRGERKGQAEWADYTEAEISRIAVELKGHAAELYKLRRSIEERE